MAQSLTVWNDLTKAVEKDKSIADIVVRAQATSEAWKILKSMVEDERSDRARELAKKQFEELSMNDDESMKVYIARAKSPALNVKYHDQEVSCQVLNGLPLSYAPGTYAPGKRNFALKKIFLAWRSSTGARTGPTATMPWPLASKSETAGGVGDVEATMAADAASATLKVARRINGSRNISRGISESSSYRQYQQQEPQQQYQRHQPRHQPQQLAQHSGA